MGRSPCCDKSKVKRGSWSPEEDATLINYINNHGTGGNWISFPRKAGLDRCGKSCRLRWLNYLRPDIKHGGFTQEEDLVICTLYNNIGSRWSVIASQLPGRTDNDVKNYWNTKLKKKLMPPKCRLPPKTDRKTASETPDNATVFQAPKDYYFPESFPSVANGPTSYKSPRFTTQGSSNLSSGNHHMSFPFSPSHQDSSHFNPIFSGWMEMMAFGVKRKKPLAVIVMQICS